MSVDSISASETSKTYVPSMGDIPVVYQKLWELHNKHPVGEELWSRVVALAKEEELTPVAARGAYGEVPLDALLTLAQKAKFAPSSIDRYALMLDRSPIGATWFDTIIGLSSPVVIDSIKDFLGTGRWQRGMDIGTGLGPLTVAMRSHCKNYVLADQSVVMLQMLRSKYRKRTPGSIF